MVKKYIIGKTCYVWDCKKKVIANLYLWYEFNIMHCSTQRLNDLGDESRSLPLWRQVIYCLCYRRILLPKNWKVCSYQCIYANNATVVIQSDFLFFAYVTNALTQAEPRFLWNNYLLEVLIENKVGCFKLVHILFWFLDFLCIRILLSN